MEMDRLMRLTQMKIEEANQIIENGWTYRYVFDADKKGKYVNVFTLGLEQTLGTFNLQMVYPMDEKHAPHFFHLVIEEFLKKGVEIKEDRDYEGVVRDLPVRFKHVRYRGKDYWRIIFTDTEGKFPGDDGCESLAAGQIDIQF